VLFRSPVPPNRIDAVLAALNQGLGERSGTPKPVDTAFFANVGKAQAAATQPAQREYAAVTGALQTYVAARWQESKSDPLRARVAMRANIPGVEEYLLARATASAHSEPERTAALQVLEELGSPKVVPGLRTLLDAGQPESIRLVSIRALARFGDPTIAAKVLNLYPSMPAALKSASRELFFGRVASASAFLTCVEADPALANEVPTEQVRMIAALSSKELDARVRKIWGNVGRGTPEEKLATMRRFNNDLRAAPGDIKAGIRVYNQVCARCHKLYGSGGELGMDLTNSNRKDRDYLLTQIVDPSVYIRKEYMSYEVHTRSSRVVSGLMVEQDGASVTLIDADYRKTRIPRSDLA
jgi:putative heme-binding domain-containing protein